MCIKRDKPGGLGLSVKGGAEHNLPILVSRIFKDQAGITSAQLSRPRYLLTVPTLHIGAVLSSVNTAKATGRNLRDEIRSTNDASILYIRAS